MRCAHLYVVAGDCKSCVHCGITNPFPFECTFMHSSYSQSHCPFFTGYCRKKRFRNLIQCLFFPSASRADDSMLKYFVENKLAPSICGVEGALRNSGQKDKRFSCIHLYAMLFSPDYMPMPSTNIFWKQKQLMFYFELFESKYVRKYQTGFINYNFILSYLLQGLGLSNYLPFIKKTKCRRRIKFYKSQLENLNFSFHVDT